MRSVICLGLFALVGCASQKAKCQPQTCCPPPAQVSCQSCQSCPTTNTLSAPAVPIITDSYPVNSAPPAAAPINSQPIDIHSLPATPAEPPANMQIPESPALPASEEPAAVPLPLDNVSTEKPAGELPYPGE